MQPLSLRLRGFRGIRDGLGLDELTSIWSGWPMVPRWSPSQAPTAAASPR
ncbi:MAG: hypothetical protein IPK42_00060 [Betaproteobacteria bacterium]|nr:hypothetical protein [Betaproteobacteria bacterium]